MAKKKAPDDKPPSKAEIEAALADATGLTRRQVAAVFEELIHLIQRNVGPDGPGAFTLPGLVKIVTQRRPATPARTVPNPFRPGEMMTVQAKPERRTVKVRPLKRLTDTI